MRDKRLHDCNLPGLRYQLHMLEAEFEFKVYSSYTITAFLSLCTDALNARDLIPLVAVLRKSQIKI